MDTGPDLKLGIYFAEVKKAEDGRSKIKDGGGGGEEMITLTLRAVDLDAHLCVDRLMLEGGGARIGSSKLGALGIPDEADFETATLIGKRIYVAVEPREFNGQTKLEVDIKGGGHCGYWPESEKPEGVIAPGQIVPGVDDDIPF